MPRQSRLGDEEWKWEMEMRIKPSGRHKRCLWSREAVSSSCSVCGFDVLPQCRLATDSAVCVVVQSMARTTQTVREGNLFTRVFPEQQIKWGFRRRCDDLAFFKNIYIYIYVSEEIAFFFPAWAHAGGDLEMPASNPGTLDEDGDLKYEWTGPYLEDYFLNDK